MEDGDPTVRLMSKGQRKSPWQPWSILFNTVVPISGFAVNYWLLSFSPRFRNNNMAILFGPVLGVVLSCCITGIAAARFKNERPAKGLISLALCSWFAVLSSSYAGDTNYWKYQYSYYTYEDMAIYINVDPNLDQGQTYMDSGQVYFKESTFVAVNKASAIQNNGVYCVAPIVRQPIENQGGEKAVELQGELKTAESGTFDFWAVGQDCCEPSGENFKCGGAGNKLARAGLRMLRDDIRPFYFMAVQEWTAKLELPARHPLFFHWVADPLMETETMNLIGTNNYYAHLTWFAFTDIILVYLLQLTLFNAGVV